MLNSKLNRLLSVILSAVLFVGILPLFVSVAQCTYDYGHSEDFSAFAPDDDLVYDILTHTQGASVGMQGFETDFDNNPNEIIEIIVQFRTPPEVALRLLSEMDDTPIRSFSAQSYEEKALDAHDDFYEQFNNIAPILPIGQRAMPVEVISEHSTLFNGVFMRVPAYMAEQIAALPEVFMVEPHIIPELPTPTVDRSAAPFVPSAEVASSSSFFVNPNLMQPIRNYYSMGYIHGELGITGRGVRVAIIDGPINYTHPELARFLGENGRLQGYQRTAHNAWWYTLEHGTMTAGVVIGMAPEVELWSFERRSHHNDGLDPVTALEMAYNAGADIIYTWDTRASTLDAQTAAVNMAVLSGRIVVVAAHNFGSNPFTVMTPGNSPLAITVGTGGGSGATGNLLIPDNVASASGRGPAPSTFHIKPDILAPGFNYSTSGNGGYGFFTGTSAATPLVAGVAALLRQEFPDAPPWEIKARIMNTGRHLRDLIPSNVNQNPDSVFAVGAGAIQPLAALKSTAFATVEHEIPWQHGRFNNVGSWVSYAPYFSFRYATMSSLSFGLVSQPTSRTLTVTIHEPGAGIWVPDIRYVGYSGGVSLELLDYDTSGETHTFTFRMNFPVGTVSRTYGGYIVFTNESQTTHTGNTRQISLPFGAYFGTVSLTTDVGEMLDFGTAPVGYSARTPRHVRVTNTGNIRSGILTMALTGEHEDSFTLGSALIPDIVTLDSISFARFSVVPITGLDAGIYTATVIISTRTCVVKSFDVRFSVIPAMPHHISLFPSNNHDFGTITYGDIDAFGAFQPFSVEVRNSGTESTGELTVSASGEHASAFIVTPSIITNIATDGQSLRNIAVRPRPGFHFPLGLVEATVTISGGNGISESFDVSFTVEGNIVLVEYVSIIGNATHNLYVDDTLQLTANVQPADATNQAVTWSSNNTAVATVSTSGQVNALSAGTATITVTTADGNFTASVTVAVNPQPTDPDIKIAFDLSGGTYQNEPDIVLYLPPNEPIGIGNIPVPTRDFHHFRGWQRYGIGGILACEQVAEIIAEKPIVFTAVWQAYTHNVTFTTGTEQTAVSIGHNQILGLENIPTPTRPGHRFSGWQDSNCTELNTPVLSNASLSLMRITEPMSFESVWDLDEHDVTFMLQGGNVGGITTPVIVPVAMDAPLIGGRVPTPIRTGHELRGWQRDGVGELILCTIVAGISVYEPMVFVAVWDGDSFDITFNLNGGNENGNESNIVVPIIYGNIIDLPNVPVADREFHRFIGWQRDGETYTRAQVSRQMITAPTTFTALWERYEHTVIFDLNGGTIDGNPANVEMTILQGESIGASNMPNEPVSATANFAGWYRENTGQLMTTAQVANLTIMTDEIFTAACGNIHTATFRLNGGNADGATGEIAVPVLDGEMIGLANVPTPSRAYHRFENWLLYGTNDVFTRAQVALMRPTDAMIFVAQWEIYTHAVQFDANGGTFDVAPGEENRWLILQAVHNTAVAALPPIDRPNQTFMGWLRQTNGDILTSLQVQQLPITQPETFVAQWDIDTHRVQFNLNGGTATDGQCDFTVEHNAMVGLANVPTPTHPNGYDFLGWQINGAGSPHTQAQVATMRITEPTTFVAAWNDTALHNVWFDLNRGTYNNSREDILVQITNGATLATGDIPRPTREFHNFMGWQIDGVGNVYSSLQIVDHRITDRTVYVAAWERYAHPITAMWNAGGIGGAVFASAILAVDGGATLSTPNRVDYIFEGWTLDAAGTKAFALTDIYDDVEDVTVYAQWTPRLLDGRFPDVFESHADGDMRRPNNPTAQWFAPHVRYNVNRGIMAGFPDGTFQPETAFTRAMFVQTLYNIAGQPEVNLSAHIGRFTDIRQGAQGRWPWFAAAVFWAAENGVISGFPDGSFRPNQYANRAEMATMMRNYAVFMGIYTPVPAGANPLQPFPDNAPAWAEDAVAWIVHNRIITGMPIGGVNYLYANGTATRAQSATIIRNFIDNLITTCDRGTVNEWYAAWIR